MILILLELDLESVEVSSGSKPRVASRQAKEVFRGNARIRLYASGEDLGD